MFWTAFRHYTYRYELRSAPTEFYYLRSELLLPSSVSVWTAFSNQTTSASSIFLMCFDLHSANTTDFSNTCLGMDWHHQPMAGPQPNSTQPQWPWNTDSTMIDKHKQRKQKKKKKEEKRTGKNHHNNNNNNNIGNNISVLVRFISWFAAAIPFMGKYISHSLLCFSYSIMIWSLYINVSIWAHLLVLADLLVSF